jgi:hypothetical protein
MTGGRTRPTHDSLEIETLVSTTSTREQTPKLTVEQRAIAALCHEILSIAEVSARLHLPLGVIRILVGDMADEHLVIVHRPAHPGDRSRPGPAGTSAGRAPQHLTRTPDWLAVSVSAQCFRCSLKTRAAMRCPTAGLSNDSPSMTGGDI